MGQSLSLVFREKPPRHFDMALKQSPSSGTGGFCVLGRCLLVQWLGIRESDFLWQVQAEFSLQ